MSDETEKRNGERELYERESADGTPRLRIPKRRIVGNLFVCVSSVCDEGVDLT